MEGVGARLGRSSSRYGPTTVFTGPVRKWKKKWIPVPPSNSNNHNHTAANGAIRESNGSASHLLLYKWSPITPSQNKDGNGNADSKASEDDAVEAEEPPRRKFKYIPIAVLEEQNNELSEQIEEQTEEQIEDEAKPNETNENTEEEASKSHGYDEKPDINDVPMEENEALENSPVVLENSTVERHDLNESPLELSLGLKADKEENESDSKDDQVKDDSSIILEH